ncbi:MAG: ligase-associated DNA damage response endonuclease PdeM [Pseudomonadota bacterium]
MGDAASSCAGPDTPAPATKIHLVGEWVYPLVEGGLWWPDRSVLVVSDLHLEKGSSFARRGQMLPPYDTGATLAVVEAMCARLAPETVISLGDSFHDRGADARLSDRDAARIRLLTAAHKWVWVEGNHDPDPPAHLGGEAAHEWVIGPITFRHEPTGAVGEVAGHLHPAAKVRRRGRSVRRRSFVSDGDRLVMPALGAFTGGLNVHDAAFSPIFPDGLMAFAMGESRIFVFGMNQLVPDRPPSAQWRL